MGREDKSEMKIFFQNILEKKRILESERVSSHLLKVKTIFGLRRPIRWRSGGETTKKEKGKGKEKEK